MEQWDALFLPRQQPSAVAMMILATNVHSTVLPLPAEQTYGQNVTKFMILCQQHAIIPNFTLQEVASHCFSGKVEFAGHTCEVTGPFPPKKQAKEEVSRCALEILEPIAKPQKIKRRSSDTVSLDEENWKGVLNEHAQRNRHRLPHFQDHEISMRAQQQNGTSENPRNFSSTLSIEAAPDHFFGSKDALFTTKADARRNAAKEAVLWLRANGMLADLSSMKQRKLPDPVEHTSLNQSMARRQTNHSVAQLIHERSIQSGFTQPSYRTNPATPPAGASGPNFYTACARYLPQDVQKEPRLQDALCQTGIVFGQKKAKQMCCESLLELLDKLVVERRSG